MNCTKCNGSGSEGFISFLRCGRCSGTGKEPADALIPYSDELIVVAKDGILTETAKLQKKQEEPERKIEEAAQAAEEAITPAPRPDRYCPPYRYGMADVPTPTAPEPKRAETIHSTHVFPISGDPGSIHRLDLSSSLLWELMGSRNPNEYKIFLRKIRFECKGKYMVSFICDGCEMFRNFYTGLGMDAKPIQGDCSVSPMFGRRDNISFTLESLDDCFVEDRILLTLFFEFTQPTQIYRPSYSSPYL